MPPNETMLDETSDELKDLAIRNENVEDKAEDPVENSVPEKQGEGWFDFKTPVIWSNVVHIFTFHAVALYGLLTYPILEHKLLTLWGKRASP